MVKKFNLMHSRAEGIQKILIFSSYPMLAPHVSRLVKLSLPHILKSETHFVDIRVQTKRLRRTGGVVGSRTTTATVEMRET